MVTPQRLFRSKGVVKWGCVVFHDETSHKRYYTHVSGTACEGNAGSRQDVTQGVVSDVDKAPGSSLGSGGTSRSRVFGSMSVLMRTWHGTAVVALALVCGEDVRSKICFGIWMRMKLKKNHRKKIVCRGTWKHNLKRLQEWLIDEYKNYVNGLHFISFKKKYFLWRQLLSEIFFKDLIWNQYLQSRMKIKLYGRWKTKRCFSNRGQSGKCHPGKWLSLLEIGHIKSYKENINDRSLKFCAIWEILSLCPKFCRVTIWSTLGLCLAEWYNAKFVHRFPTGY